MKVFELPTEAGQARSSSKSFEGHTHHVMGVGWTPDGKKLAALRRGQHREGVGLREGREGPRHAGPPEAGDAAGVRRQDAAVPDRAAATRRCGCGTRTTAATSGSSPGRRTSSTRWRERRRRRWSRPAARTASCAVQRDERPADEGRRCRPTPSRRRTTRRRSRRRSESGSGAVPGPRPTGHDRWAFVP